jgi:MtrB/PioB family decaheme-associated outer membrane protein
VKHNRNLQAVPDPARWLCLVVTLACAATAVASTKSGVDSAISNQLSESASYPVEGLATFKTTSPRSPTGLLYISPVRAEAAQANTWSSTIEIGAMFNDGDDDASQFRKYTDWDEGGVVSNLAVMGDFGATYFKFKGGAIGNDDQFFKAEYGKYGSYRIRGFFYETPHIYANDATLLYEGIGTDVLSLPAPLTPGGNTSAELANAITFASEGTIGMDRDKWGGEFHLFASANWQLNAKYTLEERDGTRLFGGSFYPTTIGGVVENLEPIDYQTHDFSLDASYSGDKTFLNVGVKASIFENDNTSLTWDNAFDIVQTGSGVANVPAEVIERGRVALAPDNEFYQIDVEFAQLLPMGAQLTAFASWSRMEQDEDLLPPTITTGIKANVDTDNWNTTAALSQLSADAQIDTISGGVELQLNPWRKLSLGARLDYFDEDNDTSYTSFNPLTGEFGYIAQDSPRIRRIYNGGGNPIHYRSIPFEKSNHSWTVDATYRPLSKTTIGVELRETRNEYSEREVEESDETRIKVFLSTRKLDWATIRFSYLSEDRDVDQYESNPYREFYTSSLPGYSPPGSGERPFTLADMRKYDIADRDIDRFESRINFLIRDDMDLMLSAQYEDTDYGGSYGLLDRESKTINVEWNYQPSISVNTYLFFSHQRFEDEMANIADSGSTSDPNAGGTTYQSSGSWSESSDETSDQFGAGIYYAGEKFGFEATFTSIDSDTGVDYGFASADATASPPLETGLSGEFSDLSFESRVFEGNLTWQSNDDWQFRLYYRYERGKIRDWGLNGLSVLEGNNLFVQAIPDDYSVHTVGLFVTRHIR